MSFAELHRTQANPAARHPGSRPALIAALLAGTLVAGWAVASGMSAQDPETEQSRRDFMRTKLLYSQNIMEGITTRNFDLIAEGAAEIRKITEAELWLAANTDEYRHFSGDLRAIADRISAAAKAGNLDAAAFRFSDMTANCMDCHEYSRAMKIY